MGKTIGIDLGTTPSVVAFTDGCERLVGAPAKRQAVTNPENTVFSIKRFMGRKEAEVKEEEKIVPFEVIPGPNGDARVKAGGKEYAPPEISAMILQKLKADAEAYLGDTVDSAVITVPAYFNDDQRQATKDAGKVAGLDVKRIINEPTAASLAYGLDKEDDQTILVFDLGGGTFDVSVLEIGDGVFEVKSTAGDNHLGGDNFDKAIVDWLAAEFKRDQGIDLTQDKMALQRLYEAAEKAKIELSSAQETQITLPFITADASGPKHLDVRLTRAKLNELASPLVERVVGPVRQAMDDAKDKGVKEIDHIVLVGGMTRMPAIQEKVKELTGKEPKIGIKAGSGLSDDEIKRMVQDAESHAEDDKRLRELAEARNVAEHTAYESEKRLKEMDEQLDAATKGELETAQKEVRESLETEDVEAIRAKTDRLNTVWHRVSEQMYERAQAEQQAAAGDGAASNGASTDSSADEEVIDAEVVDEQR